MRSEQYSIRPASRMLKHRGRPWAVTRRHEMVKYLTEWCVDNLTVRAMRMFSTQNITGFYDFAPMPIPEIT